MRYLAFALLFALPAVAVAQAPAKGTVTAEVTEVIKARPDTARLAFAIVARNADADTATGDNDTQTKQFVEAVEKLKLTGVKVTAEQLRVDRVELTNNRGGASGTEFGAVRAVVVTATDADPEKLAAVVDKVQREAPKLGATGEVGSAVYNGFQYERSGSVKVAYSRADSGWEEQTAAALTRGAKRATQRAEAMAAGTGLKLGELLSVGEVTDAAHAAAAVVGPAAAGGATVNPGVTADTLDQYVDGELVRKIRVRVVYATTK